MFRNHRARSILARAALGALYHAKEDDTVASGGGGDDTKVTLSPEELEAKLAEARESAIKEDREKRKQADKEKRARERRERGEDEEEEDPKDVIAKAEARAAEAEQRAAEAQRKAVMADVNVKLRDYLALNFKEFVGNAPDIILHVERALSAEPKDAEIARLIESHAKAFVERTKGARGALANGAPVGGIRRPVNQPPQQNQTNVTRESQPAERRFSAINWHG